MVQVDRALLDPTDVQRGRSEVDLSRSREGGGWALIILPAEFMARLSQLFLPHAAYGFETQALFRPLI